MFLFLLYIRHKHRFHAKESKSCKKTSVILGILAWVFVPPLGPVEERNL